MSTSLPVSGPVRLSPSDPNAPLSGGKVSLTGLTEPIVANPVKPPQRSVTADSFALTGATLTPYDKYLKQARENTHAEAEAERLLADVTPRLTALSRDHEALARTLAATPGDAKAAFSFQSVRFLDNVAGGRETRLMFEENPGDMHQPATMPPMLMRDAQTGQLNLTLEEARIRVSSGGYDLYLTVDGNGRPRLDKLYRDGHSVQSLMVDALKDKIRSEPEIWGPIAGVAVAGVVALAHQRAAKTGKPIGFDAINVKLYESDTLEVRGKLKAELTGGSGFVRPAGAEIGFHYHDGRLDSTTSLRYDRATPNNPTAAFDTIHLAPVRTGASLQLSTGASYAYDKRTHVFANGFYDAKNKNYGAFVGFNRTLD
jgi:hypothetical protein